MEIGNAQNFGFEWFELIFLTTDALLAGQFKQSASS